MKNYFSFFQKCSRMFKLFIYYYKHPYQKVLLDIKRQQNMESHYISLRKMVLD